MEKTNRIYTKNDIEEAEWRGGVTQSLKDINSDLKEVKGDIKTLNKRMTGIQIKMGTASGIIALIITVTLNFIRGAFSGK